ncbi:hypothetical protein [Desmospora activa]|uniref:Heat induced stress protein YflT n=1 Tax=Desmospora activa DSM 45169 TaxID=1121389 RepID=A0A2T4ZD88_9BACL|nr:hypothetical protein [Desmospora activa]PTM59858.1 hypothetical protein C8J48_2494 [Desmospora activa DSM 45169]
MGERNILAYFRTESRAKEAVQRLKEAGFNTVDLSRFSLAPEDHSDLDNPIAEPFSSLASATGADVSSRDAGILVGAHTESSGMADGMHQFGAEDLCVTVVTTADRYEQAESILKELGANI